MGKNKRRKFLVAAVILIIINSFIVYSLLKNRSFSHLAIWNILELDREEDFYWHPEKASSYFRFEQDSEKLLSFRNEIFPLVENEKDDFAVMFKVAQHIINLNLGGMRYKALDWGSPHEMLAQVKEGSAANCFHNSILFSTFLSSVGIKSRLWALENNHFDDIAHTIAEAYSDNYKKWIFFDTTLDFYVVRENLPLSFIEIRSALLSDDTNELEFYSIQKEKKLVDIPIFLKGLIRLSFLRARNDFVTQYDSISKRYFGLVSSKYYRSLPDYIKRGMSYFFDKESIFIHYVDDFSRNLRMEIAIVKALFYFFVYSLALSILITFLSLIYYLFKFLRKKRLINAIFHK